MGLVDGKDTLLLPASRTIPELKSGFVSRFGLPVLTGKFLAGVQQVVIHGHAGNTAGIHAALQV